MATDEILSIPFWRLMKIQLLSGTVGFIVLTPLWYAIAFLYGEFLYRGAQYIPLELFMIALCALAVGSAMAVLAALAYPVIRALSRRGLLRPP